MRFTVSPEQIKFFQIHSYLEVEAFITLDEKTNLMRAIQEIKLKSPGYAEENLFRSIALIPSLARKSWAPIAYELIHKKPLRIAYDKFFAEPSEPIPPIEEETCGLLINLNTGSAFFFKNFLEQKLYKSEGSCYFFVILTARHLPERLNPVVIR